MSLAKIIATLVERGEEELAEELLAVGAPMDIQGKVTDREMDAIFKAVEAAKKLTVSALKKSSSATTQKDVMNEAANKLEAASVLISHFKKTGKHKDVSSY